MKNKSPRRWLAVIFSSLFVAGLIAWQAANSLIIQADQANENSEVTANSQRNYDSGLQPDLPNNENNLKPNEVKPRLATSQDQFTFDTFDDGNLTCNLVSYHGNDSEVVIPDTVTLNGKNYQVTTSLSAFKGNQTVKQITTGKYLTTIGQDFADNCPNLAQITLNEGITTIEGWAFQNDPKLSSCALPQSLKKIGVGAFRNCSNLVTLNFANNAQLTTIGAEAFSNCTALSGNLVIPQTVTVIEANAFNSCSALTGLSFESNSQLEAIGESAFAYNTKLQGSLVIPRSVTTIESSAFSSCTALTGVSFESDSQLVSIGESAFAYDSNLQGNLIIPQKVQTIGKLAFFSCFQKGAANLSFAPNSLLNSIGDQAFAYNDYLQGETVFPDSLTSIGAHAFAGSFSKSASSLTFSPNSQLTSIGAFAFSDATFLEGTLLIPKGITTISEAAFANAYQHAGIASLNFPEDSKLTTIANNAFLNTYNFQGTTIFPASLVSIGDQAFEASFSQMSSKISFPANSQLTVIGANAFHNAAYLGGELIIPQGVKTISESAFAHAYSKGATASLKFASGSQLTTIGMYAFLGTTQMRGLLNLPEGLTALAKQAFDSAGFKELELPSTLSEIPEYCFQFAKIQTVNIPQTIKKIAEGAFYSSNLTNLKFADGIQSIGTIAFAFTRVKTVVIPPSVVEIQHQAFWAGRLEEIELPSTTRLGSADKLNDAFSWNNIWRIKINPSNGPLGAGNETFNGQSIYQHLDYAKNVTLDKLFDLNIDGKDQAKDLHFSNITNGVTFSNNTFHIPDGVNRFTFNFDGYLRSSGTDPKAYNGIYTVDFSNARIKLRNVIVTQGGIWKPDDNFVGAEDDEGNDIPFDQISVTPKTINTNVLGSYPVTYTYQGVSSTAYVIVTKRTTATSTVKINFYALDDQGGIGPLPGAPEVPNLAGFVGLSWAYTAPTQIGNYELVGSRDSAGVFTAGENSQSGTFGEDTGSNPQISFYYALKTTTILTAVPKELNFGEVQRHNMIKTLANGPQYLKFHVGSASQKAELTAKMSSFKPDNHLGPEVNGTISIAGNSAMIDVDGYPDSSTKPTFASNSLKIATSDPVATVLFNNLSKDNQGNWKVALNQDNTQLELKQSGSAGKYQATITWTISPALP